MNLGVRKNHKQNISIVRNLRKLICVVIGFLIKLRTKLSLIHLSEREKVYFLFILDITDKSS